MHGLKLKVGLWLCLGIWVLGTFQGCGGYKPDPKVDTKGHVDDSMRLLHSPVLNAVLQKADSSVRRYGGDPAALIRSESMESLLTLLQGVGMDSFLLDSTPLTSRNCLLAYDHNNVFTYFTPKRPLVGGDHPWVLVHFYGDLWGDNGDPIGTIESTLYQWQPDEEDANDSLTRSDKEEYVERWASEAKRAEDARYLLMVRDRFLVPPSMVSKEEFNPGLLVTETQLIRLADGERVGRKVLLTENSESVMYINTFRPDETKEDLQPDVVRNLSQMRHRGLIRYYDMH